MQWPRRWSPRLFARAYKSAIVLHRISAPFQPNETIHMYSGLRGDGAGGCISTSRIDIVLRHLSILNLPEFIYFVLFLGGVCLKPCSWIAPSLPSERGELIICRLIDVASYLLIAVLFISVWIIRLASRIISLFILRAAHAFRWPTLCALHLLVRRHAPPPLR